jgi:hypothetical protein
MGLPNKSDRWIWTRTPSPTEADRTRLIARARALGFDTAALVYRHAIGDSSATTEMLAKRPAILTAILLARLGAGTDAPKLNARKLAREVLLNGPVVLLMGSFLIGYLAGEPGRRQLAPFTEALFPGALCLFLLEMGLVATRQLRAAVEARRRSPEAARALDPRLLAFAVLMPLVGAAAGIGAGWGIGLSVGGVALFGTLAASASYIAVPAAMRLALPQADAGVYLTLSVAVTFPFNIAVGIPLYIAMARMVAG